MLLILGIAGGAIAKSPGEKDKCKNGGWQQYGFRNQGQCISFVNHGGKLGSNSPMTSLTITKSGPPGVFPSQEFDYRITVKNTGVNPAVNSRIVDTLPSSGSFVSSSAPGTPQNPGPGSTYTIPLGDIQVGDTLAVTIRWKAPSAGPTNLHNSAFAAADNAPDAGPVSSDVPVGIATACNPCGAIAAGTGLRNRDHGDIAIGGIPSGATVGRAVLVWAVLYADTSPPSNEITFQGHQITADVTQSVSGTLCWGDTATIGFAADVTPYVTGNGTYVVSDPVRGETRPDNDPHGTLPFTDGASLVVFYTGGGANNQVLSDFSYDTNTDPNHVIDRSFSGIHSVGKTATLLMAGPDGQGNGFERFTFTGNGSIVLDDTWNGSDPQFNGPFSGGIGSLWDTDVYDMSAILPSGQNTLQFHHEQTSDCIGVGAAVLQVSQS